MTDISVRDLAPDDEQDWRRLFAGYREYYECEPSDEVLDRVWSWIQDPGHELGALVAEADGRVAGIAHHRSYCRPCEGETGLFLDDLFTDASTRGQGVGRALLESLTEIARDRGAAKVRWVTAPDNTTAQRLYDDVASRTDWLTYDLMV